MIYWELFFTFFKIGAFTFGGGYAMLPFIQAEVQQKGWMALQDLVNFIAVSESTPGPFAVNIATYVGAETGGFLGACFATIGVVLPSFVIILIIARCLKKFQNSSLVKGCLSGLKPAVVGLIAASLLSIGQTVFFPDGFYWTVFLSPAFLCSFVIFTLMLFLQWKKFHPIWIILLSAGLGLVTGYLGLLEPTIAT